MPEIVRGKIVAGDTDGFLVTLDLPAKTSVVIHPLKYDKLTKEVVFLIDEYNCLDCGFQTTSKEKMQEHQKEKHQR